MHPLLPPVRDVGSLPPRDMSCGTAPGGSCMGNRCRTGGRPDRIPTTRRVCGILASCRKTLLGRGSLPSKMRPLSSRESFLMGGPSLPKPLRRPTPQGEPAMTPACVRWSGASPCTRGKTDDLNSSGRPLVCSRMSRVYTEARPRPSSLRRCISQPVLTSPVTAKAQLLAAARDAT